MQLFLIILLIFPKKSWFLLWLFFLLIFLFFENNVQNYILYKRNMFACKIVFFKRSEVEKCFPFVAWTRHFMVRVFCSQLFLKCFWRVSFCIILHRSSTISCFASNVTIFHSFVWWILSWLHTKFVT